MFIHCSDEDVKQDFLSNSVCYYKGHAVKFFEWVPNCDEDNLDFSIPSWFSLNPIPPELKQIDIIKRIVQARGDLIGLDASFECCNNIKLLINCKTNSTNLKPLKIITNRLMYSLNI